jgi:histone deacetylase 11
MPRVVYSPAYNIGGYGIERLHPFDGQKYGKAWDAIRGLLPAAQGLLKEPGGEGAVEDLRLVHSADYLKQLRSASYLAQVFETPAAAWLPAGVLDALVLKPMRWAVQGTILAFVLALEQGLAINLGGGFHHAKPTRGEGFNAYNDVAIGITRLRQRRQISPEDVVLYVDCDAHQGNGVATCFLHDRTLKIFDVFNSEIYPRHDAAARTRVDRPVPLPSGTDGEAYLLELQRSLPPWLDEFTSRVPPALAIYNAGTDVVADDPLGALALAPQHILERDVFVVESLLRRSIPTAMVLGGGYTQDSYRLVADSVAAILGRALAAE